MEAEVKLFQFFAFTQYLEDCPLAVLAGCHKSAVGIDRQSEGSTDQAAS